jgi:iron complex transport system ATP-binding protein
LLFGSFSENKSLSLPDMDKNEYILSLSQASIGFHKKHENKQLLENVNLQVKTGELIGLIGRNGAGKSTFIRCIVRLQKLLHGSIHIQNRNIEEINPNEFAQLVAYVSSSLEYAETMTVRELVSLGRFPYTNWIGKLTSRDIELVNSALESVGIDQLSERKLSEISDGERQKAMIARTLAQDTQMIILDEPTAFLDLPSKYDIISLLHDLTRKGKTVIYSTHDLNIAIRFSDKIWLIDAKSIHDGSPEDLILDNTIAGIFDSEKIHMNILSGDFELRKEYDKSICIKSDIPEFYYWTCQALQRAGYKVVAFNKDIPLIIIEKQDNKIFWIIQRFNENMRFSSIFDMLTELQQTKSIQNEIN